MPPMISVPPLERLPIELLDQIISLCSPTTQSSMCQVSKRFEILATRLLYRVITLDSRACTIKCCKALKSKPDLAPLVKHFSVDAYLQLSWSESFRSFFRLLGNHLCSLSGLTRLELGIHKEGYGFLAQCTFPLLMSFTSAMLVTPLPDLVAFLNRHQQLTYLKISPCYDFYDDFPPPDLTDRPIVRLPNLVNLYAVSVMIPVLFTPARTVCVRKTIIVNWDMCYSDRVQVVFDALSTIEKLPTLMLRSFNSTPEYRLVRMISEQFPQLGHLSVHEIIFSPASAPFILLEKNALNAIASYVSRFTSLKSLFITRTSMPPNPEIDLPDFDTDLLLVRQYGLACHSLRLCVLPSRIKWVRLVEQHNVWMPYDHPLGPKWVEQKLTLRQQYWFDAGRALRDAPDTLENVAHGQSDVHGD